MPNLANIISITRRKIRLVLKRHKGNKNLYGKASGIFLFFFVSFVLPYCLWLYLALEISASREQYSRDINRRVQGL